MQLLHRSRLLVALANESSFKLIRHNTSSISISNHAALKAGVRDINTSIPIMTSAPLRKISKQMRMYKCSIRPTATALLFPAEQVAARS